MTSPEVPVSVVALGATAIEFGNETGLLARVVVRGPGVYDWLNETGDTQYVFANVLVAGEVRMQFAGLRVAPGDTYRLTLP